MRTKGRRRGSGPAREIYKGADHKTEVPAYQMLQCKLRARPRRIRGEISSGRSLARSSRRDLNKSGKKHREIELTISSEIEKFQSRYLMRKAA